jgi:formyltetrahydrofolate deformylase
MRGQVFMGGEQRLHAPDFFDQIGIQPDLIVLARYMRILPPEMVARYPNRIINVHHALLPAFIGANTYERALERGVRVMGATAHYVTEELDQGPIICQQAFSVDPTMTLDALKQYGANYEAAALRNAVAAHASHMLLPLGQHVVRFPCAGHL